MTLENIKTSITQTKNPLYFQMGIRVDAKVMQDAKLSHEGMAFTVLAKDELKALMGAGLRPFAKATLDVDFREEANPDPTKNTLLKFDLNSAKFTGGMGSWETLLEAPVRVKETKPEAPAGF